MNLWLRRGALIGMIGFALASAVASPAAQADQHTHTLVLNQQPPSLRPLDQGDAGVSVGDLLLFEAALSGENGESGTLTGLLVTADIADEATNDIDADRLGQFSYDLGNGNTLVAVGESIYRGESVEMTATAPQLRAVVGGTGSFIGARGQVLTIRNPDGTYRHEFTLLDN